jgi:hypothetical protein
MLTPQYVTCDESVLPISAHLGRGHRARLRLLPVSPQQATRIRLYALMGALGTGALVCAVVLASKALYGV